MSALPSVPALRASLRRAARAAAISPADFYAGMDWGSVRRFGIALWLLGLLLTMSLLPIAPPVAETSPAVGWSATAALLVLAIGRIVRAVRRPQLSGDVAQADVVLSLGGLVVLSWLSHSELYQAVMLLPAVYCATVAPPRRALFVLALAVAASFALAGVAEHEPGATGALGRSILWVGLAVLAMGWAASVRRERSRLLLETETERSRALSDALTGLGNRRAFDAAMHVELARAERTGHPFVLLSMDLDDFKRINDEHGHLAGDRVLADAAAVLAEHSRPPDAWFRWGGDEFSGLYPATTERDAETVRERLIGELAMRCRRPDDHPLRAQVGIAAWRPGMTGADLMTLADAAVLAAKRERRLQRSPSSARPVVNGG